MFCDGAFTNTYGKTAHGLVRRTRRYNGDGRDRLDGRRPGCGRGARREDRTGFRSSRISNSALSGQPGPATPATHFVIGIAPDGGRLSPPIREAIGEAIDAGLNVDAGLHDFLKEDRSISRRAAEKGVQLRDVRATPPRGDLHAWTGKIDQVTSYRVAVLGTDSAIGKRTTAWVLVEALENAGLTAEMIGTGQTAWLQGARYGLLLDSLVSDFMAGEIEHATWLAWKEQRPDVLVLEGQGSLMNPGLSGRIRDSRRRPSARGRAAARSRAAGIRRISRIRARPARPADQGDRVGVRHVRLSPSRSITRTCVARKCPSPRGRSSG